EARPPRRSPAETDPIEENGSAAARQQGSSQLQRRVQVAIMIEGGEVRRGGERMPLGGPERVERRRREACHQTIPYVAANTEGRRLRCLGGQPIGGTAVAGQYVRVRARLERRQRLHAVRSAASRHLGGPGDGPRAG